MNATSKLLPFILFSLLIQSAFSATTDKYYESGAPESSDAPELYDFDYIIGLGLPVIAITTENGEMPSVEFVSAPEGCMGNGTINATKVPGRVERFETDGTMSYSSGDYVKKESGMTIKIRGNSSAYRDMKPYKIKLQKKADLLNRGDKKYNDKNWALVADIEWREWIGYNVANCVHRQWSPKCEFVNVMFNGKFHGTYILTETIERNEDSRINVSDEGYVAEKDPYWWTEDGEYIPSAWNPSYNYTLKYPEFEDLTPEFGEEIAADLDRLIEVTAKPGYSSYIDIDSWVDYVLLHDFIGTTDSGGCNLYYTKYDKGSKIGIGPSWDHDMSTNASVFSGSHIDEANYIRLFANEDKEFVKAYVARFYEIEETVNNLIERLLAEGPCEPETLEKSINLSDKVVAHRLCTHAEIAETYGKWFATHKGELRAAVDNLNMTAGVAPIVGEGEVRLSRDGNCIKASGMTDSMSLRLYSVDGSFLKECLPYPDNTAVIPLDNYSGCVIAVCGSKTLKVIL